MLITVQIPSCSKKNFSRCLSRLQETCSDHKEVEILVKIDIESELSWYKNELNNSKFINNAVFSTPETGYRNLGNFHNNLAKQSKGEIIWTFFDDGFIKHGDWVSEFRTIRDAHKDGIYSIAISCGENRQWFSICTAVSREWVKCLGYLTVGYMIDYWIALVGRDINRYIRIPTSKLHVDHVASLSKVNKPERKQMHKILYAQQSIAVAKLKEKII